MSLSFRLVFRLTLFKFLDQLIILACCSREVKIKHPYGKMSNWNRAKGINIVSDGALHASRFKLLTTQSKPTQPLRQGHAANLQADP